MLKLPDHQRKLDYLLLLGVCLWVGLLAACAPAQPAPGQPPVATLRVVMDDNYPPYVFENEDGQVQGILVDEWKLWEQKTGVKVEITALPWGEALERMRAGEFDVIDTLFYTEERAQFFEFTKPYAKINVCIFFRQNISGLASVADLKGFQVAAKAGDANADFLQEQGQTRLVFYDSYEAILQAAARKEVNIFVMDEPPALYFLYKYGLQDQFNFSAPLDGGEFHRAVKKNDFATLKLVNQGFAALTQAEKQAITERWFGVEQRDLLQKWTPYLVIGISISLLAILVLFVFNRTLRQRVQARTGELQQALENLQSSEMRFRAAIEFLPIPISIADDGNKILLVNRKFTENYGYTLEDLPTTSAWRVLAYPDPDYRAQVLALWEADVAQAVAAGNSTTPREYRVTCKDGHQSQVEITMHPVGNLWIGSFNNITSRKQVEEALRESETIFSSFLEHSPVYVFFKDKNIRSLRLSKNYEQMLGMPISAALGKSMDELFPSELAKNMVADDLRILNEGQRVEIVEELNGRVYETTKFPIYQDEQPLMLAGFTVDITERKHAEAALRESEENYRALVELSPDGIIVHRDGLVIFANPAALQLIRAPESAAVLGKPVLDFVHPEMRTTILGRIEQMTHDEVIVPNLEERFLCFDGTVVDVEVVAMPIHYEGQPAIQVIIRDITERKQMLDRLRASEEKYRTLIETINTGIFMSTLDGRFLQINSAVVEMGGYDSVDELMQISATNLYTDSKYREQIILQLQRNGFVKNIELPSVKKDGSVYWIELSAVLLKDAGGNPSVILGAIADITARRQSADALQESEQRFRTLIENSADALTLLNADGSVIYEGPTVERLTGYAPAERLGKSGFENIYPADLPVIKETIGRILASPGQSLNSVFRSIRRDGSVWWTEGTATNLLDDPRVQAIVVNYRDITERKQAEEKLRESEQRYRTLFELANDAIFIETDDDRIVDANNAACKMLGYSRQELVKLRVSDVVAPEMKRTKRVIREELAAFGSKPFESVDLRKDGVHLLVEVTNTILSEHLAISIVRDVTERKKAEDELRQSENRFRILFENAGVGVAQNDAKTGLFIRMNQKYCEIVGYTREELVSMDWISMTHPDDLQQDLENMERLQAGEISEYSVEKRYYRKNGTLVWVLLTVSPMWSPGEPPTTHIGVVHDITEQKRAEYSLRYSEAEVRQLNAELERRVTERTTQLEVANKELEAFAYSVSHDLRAPLRAIDGFSRILMEDHASELDAEARELLEHVRSANLNMSQLVDALLGLSRMTRAEMHKEEIDFSQLAHSIVENLRNLHPERQVECEIAPDIFATGDARLLRVVLENLLGNAWKFTSKRQQAQIEFGMEERQGEKLYYVRDNGAGFNMAYANKLFGAFQRLHTTSEFEGTGIGLATVQRIVHRHGGKVWAESEVGKGATFYFTLG